MSFVSLFAQTSSNFNYDYSYTTTTGDAAATGAGIVMLLVWLLIVAVLTVLMVASMWKLFKKAGKEGWAAIVPIYNTIVMLEIIGRPIWWIVLFFIPFVNIVVGIIIALDFAKVYGKGTGFGLLLVFLPYIGYPVLAFSKDTKYVGPLASGETPAAPSQPAAM